mmetsp:Transcript_117125/g.363994  ORF Transcript_117125/g.363994 Transcript_117125/m.363994 type:complete len:328 (-) Transcript_117125:3-986(-)
MNLALGPTQRAPASIPSPAVRVQRTALEWLQGAASEDGRRRGAAVHRRIGEEVRDLPQVSAGVQGAAVPLLPGRRRPLAAAAGPGGLVAGPLPPSCFAAAGASADQRPAAARCSLALAVLEVAVEDHKVVALRPVLAQPEVLLEEGEELRRGPVVAQVGRHSALASEHRVEEPPAEARALALLVNVEVQGAQRLDLAESVLHIDEGALVHRGRRHEEALRAHLQEAQGRPPVHEQVDPVVPEPRRGAVRHRLPQALRRGRAPAELLQHAAEGCTAWAPERTLIDAADARPLMARRRADEIREVEPELHAGRRGGAARSPRGAEAPMA